MAKTAKQFANTPLTTTLTTILYTAPALTPAAIVKEIIVVNTNTTTARAVTIKFNGGPVMWAQSIPPLSSVILALSSVMNSGQTITGGQDVGTDVDVFASGIEYS